MTVIDKVFDIQKQSGKPFGNRYTGEFGIEIETESLKKYDYPQLKYWNCHKDGSLRDWGVEYVLKAPVNGAELERPLHEFSLCEQKYKFKSSSISTSVHVHVNFQNETYLSAANFLTAYALVENVLIRYSGPDRLSNLFCLPLRDAEGTLDKWTDLLGRINRNGFSKLNVSADAIKYSALNVAPLTTLGTLEIRSFRGVTDIDVIQRWCDIIRKLKVFACRPGMTPPQIVNMWLAHKSNILDLIFGEFAKELKTKDVDQLIDINQVLYASKIACVSKDWTKFGLLKLKPVYKAKIQGELDALAMDRLGKTYDQLQFPERQLVIEMYHIINPNQKVVDVNEDI